MIAESPATVVAGKPVSGSACSGSLAKMAGDISFVSSSCNKPMQDPVPALQKKFHVVHRKRCF